jgi:hypothetical protein
VINRDTVDQLFATYAWAIDAREFELLNGVFSANATFAVSIAGVEAVAFEGRAALVDFIATTTREQTDQRRHVITNLRLSGESSATANLTLIVVADGELTVKTAGVYRVELAQEDGAWRFAVMDLALDLAF